MKRRIIATTIATGLTAACCFAGQYYVKELTFPADADSATKVEMAGQLVGNEQQQQWQQRELTAFLHFGMNTFTDREWGDGKESPSTFAPDDIDTDQWVKTLKDAGFEMVILTAKHHDGFCLWPTATTTHSVASSPWRDGKGDVVADLRKSCDKYGMKLGLYLSPWDRNAECYGDSPRYNDMFVTQLTELLTNYGKVDEVWFDGACAEGPNGKKQEYDWLRFRETMRRLQPEAVLAITGDDVRWVGNEGGKGRETEWSVTPLVPSIYSYSDSVNAALGIDAMSKDIGSRQLIAKADRLYWWPSEVDVSIRPGWFYHENEKPHSLARLARIYLESAGRNSVLLLNVPPDTHGRIADADAERLMELHRWIDTNFSNNLLGRGPLLINCIVATEEIAHGQRVEAFDVEALINGAWEKVAEGTTIGKKRILCFDPVTADDVRLTIRSSRGVPDASLSGAYLISMPEDKTDLKKAEPLTKAATIAAGQTLIIDLGKEAKAGGLSYTPMPDDNGLVLRYTVMASNDAINWTPVLVDDEFGNIEANPITRNVTFDQPLMARYISLTCLRTATDRKYRPTASEIEIY
ncbi:MAG: alpha-L-fucosidase [Bacteroides sp.]|nr:alpha-L-fucosidase [Bacteroides sp.]MCM1413908.1 alpha-L-fucosidase [Bacteroides sp.]